MLLTLHAGSAQNVNHISIPQEWRTQRLQNFCYEYDLLSVEYSPFITMHLFGKAIFVEEEEPYDN